MKTILLAAGQSKRVKPIEDKSFVKICGKSLIDWQLMSLRKGGFQDLVIVGGKHNLERLNELRCEGMNIEVVEQVDLETGMLGAMMAVKPLVIDEDKILVVSSNDVVESDLWKKIHSGINADRDIDGFLVAYKVKRYFPGGYLSLNEAGFIQSIVEKPGEGNEPSDLVNLVIHVHSNVTGLYSALESVQSDTDDLYELALQSLFSAGKKYRALPYAGFWQAVKYPWHFLRLTEFFLGRLERDISRRAEIASTAVVNGPVVIEDGVRIFDQVVINGPAYLGKDCIVGNFAMIRASSIGDKCVVGSYTEVARSILQDEVWTHKNYIGDSVIGSNVSFGSGTVTGNLRLDEGDISSNINGEMTNSRRNKLGLITGDNIRVGINTSFMPGVKIGSDSMVGAHLNIGQDIPAGSFVKGSGSQLDIRQNQKEVGRR